MALEDFSETWPVSIQKLLCSVAASVPRLQNVNVRIDRSLRHHHRPDGVRFAVVKASWNGASLRIYSRAERRPLGHMDRERHSTIDPISLDYSSRRWKETRSNERLFGFMWWEFLGLYWRLGWWCLVCGQRTEWKGLEDGCILFGADRVFVYVHADVFLFFILHFQLVYGTSN